MQFKTSKTGVSGKQGGSGGPGDSRGSASSCEQLSHMRLLVADGNLLKPSMILFTTDAMPFGSADANAVLVRSLLAEGLR